MIDSTPTHLPSGESHLLRLPAGTCLHLASGHLLLKEMPGWLDAAVPTPVVALRAGAVHVVQQGTWLRLDALSASRLIWRWPAPRAAQVPRWRVRLASWWAAAAWRAGHAGRSA